MPKKQLAIIRAARWDDVENKLVFDVYVDEVSGSTHFLDPEEALQLCLDFGIVNSKGISFSDLNGKPMWANKEGNSVELAGPCIFEEAEED